MAETWIWAHDDTVDPAHPWHHLECQRCGIRDRVTDPSDRTAVDEQMRAFVEMHRNCGGPTDVGVAPEHFWRDVWHEYCPQRGPMRRLEQELTIEDGSVLRLYECLGCTARCFAGLDSRRYVVTRYAASHPTQESAPR